MSLLVRILSILAVLGVLMLATRDGGAQRQSDWVLRNARIWTGDPTQPYASALAVRGGRFVYVGDDDGVQGWIGSGTRVVDGSDLHVYPGLVDAHAHLLHLGNALSQVDLVGAESKDETLARVAEWHRNLAAGEWLQGRGWDQNDWPETRFPTASDLDAVVGDRPVALERIDGHALWVSSAALRAAAIDRDTPDPEGGRIVRDESGAPTGVLIDNAELILLQRIPAPNEEILRQRYLRAQEACLAVGLTGVHDMGVKAPHLRALRALDGAGQLKLRVYAALSDDPELWQTEFERGPQLPIASARLTVRSIKLYSDGALGSRGAMLLEDYSDDPGNRGLPVTPPDSLLARALRAGRAGFQVCIHAIGDSGNRVSLDALAAVSKRAEALDPGAHGSDPRSRIEHAQVVSPDDFARFHELGVIASMQPAHCTSDMPWAPGRLGPERLKGAYAWRRFLDLDVRLALGSDFPVESHDPRYGLYAAVTRRGLDGEPEGGWSPDQRLRLEEALAGFTREAAYASFRESDLGVVGVGRSADLTLYDRLLSGEEPQSLLEARVVGTVIGGELVYGSDAGRLRWEKSETRAR